MSKVVLFEHQGVRAAVPASQIVRLDDVVSAALPTLAVRLWSGEVPTHGRVLVFRCFGQDFSLCCREVNLQELSESSLRPLSALLREILWDLPHVVGTVCLGTSTVWLVDLSRFGAGGPVEERGSDFDTRLARE